MITLGTSLFCFDNVKVSNIVDFHANVCLFVNNTGVFTFIPGSYHTWILFQSWRGVPGYSYDQIPDLYDERDADRM